MIGDKQKRFDLSPITYHPSLIMMNLANTKALVLGAGKSGVAASRFLRGCGAVVALQDRKELSEWTDEARELKEIGVGLLAGEEIPGWLLDQIELLVVSPGVPTKAIPIRYLERKGALVLGEVELAFRFMRGRIIAITGSNGKTTTTSLVNHIMRSFYEPKGIKTFVGGNIGTPLISLADRTTDDCWTTAELSSFQLETIIDFRPRIAAVLNVTPDHLDRYEFFTDYAAAKHRIFRNQTVEDTAVLNADDETVMSWRGNLSACVVEFSSQKELREGFFTRGNQIIKRDGAGENVVATKDDTQLVGRHNLENICAAFAMTEAAGVSLTEAREALRGFKPVEHRLELVMTDERRGLRFYNDSKATNVDAAVKALEAFADDEMEQGKIVLIAGGQSKHAPYAPLAPLLERCGRALITIGEDAPRIEAELKQVVEVVRADNMKDAVKQSIARAQSGDIILLAPACASFDMFSGYDERGRAFKSEVKELND